MGFLPLGKRPKDFFGECIGKQEFLQDYNKIPRNNSASKILPTSPKYQPEMSKILVNTD